MASGRAGLAAFALAGLVAGCGGSSSSSPGNAGGSASGSAAVGARAQTLAADPCRTRVAPAAEKPLSAVRPVFVPVPGLPFGIASSPDGRSTFVSSITGERGELTLLSGQRRVRTIGLGPQVLGLAISADGRLLVGATPEGVVLIDANAAETASRNPVLGATAVRRGSASGGIDVALSADGRFAFETLEYRGKLAVFDLTGARALGAARLVGTVRLGIAPVGVTLSPDGHELYVTSEAAGGGLGSEPSHGLLTVLDVARAESRPAASVIASVAAGCSPVRAAVSPDGSTVWVTARGGDQLLAFSTAKLRTHAPDALLAAVHVGAAPVGLVAVRGGREILVADSNRFSEPGAHSGLTLVDATAALAGHQAVVGEIAAGKFPRQVYLAPHGQVALVSNFASGQLEVVPLAGLP